MRKRFTQEFKQDAVSQVTDKGFPDVEIAERLGGSAGKLSASAEEIRKLKAELRRVTEERDILKMAATYFAKTSKWSTCSSASIVGSFESDRCTAFFGCTPAASMRG